MNENYKCKKFRYRNENEKLEAEKFQFLVKIE